MHRFLLSGIAVELQLLEAVLSVMKSIYYQLSKLEQEKGPLYQGICIERSFKSVHIMDGDNIM